MKCLGFFLPSLYKVTTYSLQLQRLAKRELALIQKSCHHMQPGAASQLLAECKHIGGTVTHSKVNFIAALDRQDLGDQGQVTVQAHPPVASLGARLVEGP